LLKKENLTAALVLGELKEEYRKARDNYKKLNDKRGECLMNTALASFKARESRAGPGIDFNKAKAAIKDLPTRARSEGRSEEEIGKAIAWFLNRDEGALWGASACIGLIDWLRGEDNGWDVNFDQPPACTDKGSALPGANKSRPEVREKGEGDEPCSKLDRRGKIKLSEGDIRKQIKGFLASQGLYVSQIKVDTDPLRNFLWYNVASALSYKGIPDMTGAYCRRVFWIEAKAPGKKPTPVQAKFIQMLRNQEQQVFVVDSLEQFMDEWSEWKKTH
jgi:hypothetical protein